MRVDIDPTKGVEALKSYLAAASGLTETTVEVAKELAAALVAQGIALGAKAPDVVGQVQDLADDLVVSSRENREMLAGLVSTEVERAAGRMGFVREDELAALRRQVERLQRQVDDLVAGRPLSSTPPASAPVAPPTAVAPAADATTPAAAHAMGEAAEPVASDPVTADVLKPKKKIYLDPEAQQ